MCPEVFVQQNTADQQHLAFKTRPPAQILLQRHAVGVHSRAEVVGGRGYVPQQRVVAPSPTLQVDRVNANQNTVWWRDLRRGSFKAWEKSTEHDEFNVWRARDGLQMLMRSSTTAIMVLRAAGVIKQDQLLITGRSMAGNVMYSGTFPASTRLTMKTVTKDAVSSLQRRNLLRSTQKLQWTSGKGALVPDHLVYKPSNAASLYQNYKRRLNGKTDMRVKALKL